LVTRGLILIFKIYD